MMIATEFARAHTGSSTRLTTLREWCASSRSAIAVRCIGSEPSNDRFHPADSQTRERKYVVRGATLAGEAACCVVKVGPKGEVVLITTWIE